MSQLAPNPNVHSVREASLQGDIQPPQTGTRGLDSATIIAQTTMVFAHSALAAQLYNQAGTLIWMNERHRALFGLPDVNHGVGSFNLLNDAQVRTNAYATTYAQALAGNIAQMRVPLRWSDQDAQRSSGAPVHMLDQELLPLRDGSGAVAALLVLTSLPPSQPNDPTNNEQLYRSVERRAHLPKVELETMLAPLQQEAAANQRVLALIEHHELQELQRIESLGLLVRNLAHDFNNLLTRIQGNADLALMSMEDETFDLTQEHLVQICAAVNQAAQLTSQILTYTRREKFTSALINLNDVSLTISELMHKLRRYQCQIYVYLAKDLPLINLNPTQARQVILNLLFNAAEALDNGLGTITLTTAHGQLSQAELQPLILGAHATPGHFVQITVSDTGCGIAPEHMQQLFKPFFSTRLRGRGLGLVAVHGIVAEYRGAMRVTSTPGEGTTFDVWLPVHPDSS
ncbi:two-component system sensor histidine kinase NtrB [Candidatus Viridilinea mediisalina]|uniref:histidine kinase n=1 Tax=Candidatus Viridilinea mediisalina TaxID=2024553 RepID=A0A2A6RHZ1_9CHLR|nr:ATP-binding protein [Candidatus Viridilinea mediisalina]PDW02488.1 hypothetical protein CJ255_13665 [Candidatus Viridilinea mediisalina]